MSSLEEGKSSKKETLAAAANERSALLSKNNGGSSSISIGLNHDNIGEFNDDSVEVAKMKRLTHNDPTLNTKDEDYKNLLGSTRLLYNATVEQELEAELRKKAGAAAMTTSSGRNGSFSMPYGGTASNHFDLHDLDRQELPSSSSGGQQQQQPESFKNRVAKLSSASTRASQGLTMIYNKQRDSAALFLDKVKHSFFEDAKSMAAGTIPQSVVVATSIGVVCGVACWIYYTILTFFLEYLWTTLPEQVVIGKWREDLYWLWIPLVSFVMISLVGLTVVFMGEPGDLPYTIGRVHAQAFIPVDHVHPMAFASLFSILAGGSLGPEAPLVAICGALGGFISRSIFRQNITNIVRKHTLMGMAGALAAFFGVPLGGSLFALEVCSRFGVEYFEHLIESIFCGEICLMVFRSLSGLPIAPIWDLTSHNGRMLEATPSQVLLGGALGLYGAFLAYLFALFHWKNMSIFGSLDLLDNRFAVYRGWLASIFIIATSVLVPHTAFWGEEEIQVVANMGPAKDLPNIWPTTGLLGFEMNSCLNAVIVGFTKLIAISFTVAGGLRGGYIFPLMLAGSSFGRAIYYILPESVPVQVAVLCTAAGMNVAITRTAMASTLILAFLPGEPCAIPAILMASICSLFATSYMPFIKSQITRSDIDHSLFHEEHHISVDAVLDEDDDEDDDH